MPAGELPLDAVHWLLALVPILVLLSLLIVFRWDPQEAGPIAMFVAALIAVFIYQAPPELLAVAAGKGIWDAIFVLYVVWTALLLYHVIDQAGGFAALHQGIQHYTENELFIVLAFGWVFASFLQGIAGFGTPIAVVAPLLLALGMRPVYAVSIPLIGHAWANLYGTIGVGWLATEQVITIQEPLEAAFQTGLLLWIPNVLGAVAIAWLYGRTPAVRHAWPMIVIISILHGGIQLGVALVDPVISAFLAGTVGLLALIPLAKLDRYAEPAEGIDNRPAMSEGGADETGGEEGGSAVDAAIAANAVLCVAYPHMAGLGGDGFWLIHDGDVRALNASGPAAGNATREYYRDRGYDEIPSRGPEAAVTVPGAVDGWRKAHEEYGKLDWAELFAYAIRYAHEGVAVGRSLADWLADDEALLRERSASEVFVPDGTLPREGDRLIQDDLAESLETIAEDGPRDGFYGGEIAEQLCNDLDESPLEATDFTDFEADWVDPISASYGEYTAYEFPPNTQGFTALQILNLLDGFDVTEWGDNTVEYYHHMAEAVKLAFADRDEWLTDPEFVDIPLDDLLSAAYADERREEISSESAMAVEDVEPGISFDGDARRADPNGDTVYLCAVDDDGLAVSTIQSIYHDFGVAEVGGDTGIIPQNRGSFFSLEEDHPNRLEPGKRTFHTLIPAMLTRDGEPHLVYGTMGGEGQPQTHAALVTRLVDFGYDVQQAIEAPRWLMGRTWGAESRELSLEGRIPDPVIRELDARGQPIKMLPDWDDNTGHAQAIRIDSEGFLEGGADPRGDGAALGF